MFFCYFKVWKWFFTLPLTPTWYLQIHGRVSAPALLWNCRFPADFCTCVRLNVNIKHDSVQNIYRKYIRISSEFIPSSPTLSAALKPIHPSAATLPSSGVILSALRRRRWLDFLMGRRNIYLFPAQIQHAETPQNEACLCFRSSRV